MSSLQGSPQPPAFQYSGLGPAPLPPLEVAFFLFLLVEVCVSLNGLNYLTEHDIDEKTFIINSPYERIKISNSRLVKNVALLPVANRDSIDAGFL